MATLAGLEMMQGLILVIRIAVFWCLAPLLGGLPAYAGECVDAAQDSEPQDRQGWQIKAFCGVAAPEDMVLFDDRYLLMSSMAPAGHLFGFDLATELLAPVETVLASVGAAQNWGDLSCRRPTAMVTHGLDLSRRGEAWQLLAVNHEGRESIEFFDVSARDDGTPVLHWRGCVMAADNAQFNDVAALPDGGFLATDPITASLQLPRMLLGAMGRDTGQVYRWRPSSGYEAVSGTRGAYPNGVTLSADRQSFYLNLYLDNEIRQHDLATGEVLKRVSVNKPDNSSLAPDGDLLVASHGASIFSVLKAIVSKPDERNTIPYDIVQVDTGSFAASVLYRSDGQAMGGGTVGQMAGGALYIGAFRSDRMIRVRFSNAAHEDSGSIKLGLNEKGELYGEN